MENNKDPLMRRIAVIEVDQASSVANQSGVAIVPYDVANKAFPKSDTLKIFYETEKMIDSTLVVCLYHVKNSLEVRRRLIVSEVNTLEEIKDVMEMAANSVGVHINFHDLEVSSSITKINQNKLEKKAKEKELFFYTLIDFYKGDISANPEKQLEEIRELVLREASFKGDTGAANLGSMLDTYLDTKDNAYKVAGLFGKHLAETDLKLSTKYIPVLPKNFILEFPFGFKFNDFYIKSAIVSTSCLKDGETKALNVVCPKYVDGEWDGTLFTTTLDISNSDSVEDSLKTSIKFFYDKDVVEIQDVDTYKNLITFCLKCLIYIHSSEPNIVRSKGSISNKKSIAKIRKFYKHNCPFDIATLGYSFHALNGGDEFMVRGHFRWQPCGTKLTEIKLIWIDTYAKNKKEGEGVVS